MKQLSIILLKHSQVRVIANQKGFLKIAVDAEGKKPYDVLSDAKKQATKIVFADDKNLEKLFGGSKHYSPTHIGHQVGVVNLRGSVAQNSLTSSTTDAAVFGADTDLVNQLKAEGLKAFQQVIASRSTKESKTPLKFGLGNYKDASIKGGVLKGITEIETELQGQFYNDIMQANLGIGQPYSEKEIGVWIKEAYNEAQKAMWNHYSKLGVGAQFTKEGSHSMRDDLIGMLLKSSQKIKKKKIKIKKYNKNPKKTAPKPVKKSLDITLGAQTHTAASALGDVKAPSSSRQKATTESGGGLAPLVALLNSKLPQTVARNMGPPGLENQTGRFASSVRVTDVNRTAQGHPSIGYSYQKNPYQVFEMSHGDPRWATPDRDPRKLIDASIREIATQFAIGRFYTRRI